MHNREGLRQQSGVVGRKTDRPIPGGVAVEPGGSDFTILDPSEEQGAYQPAWVCKRTIRSPSPASSLQPPGTTDFPEQCADTQVLGSCYSTPILSQCQKQLNSSSSCLRIVVLGEGVFLDKTAQ
jgi:hypothetical protein